jgi:hypothetical protein
VAQRSARLLRNVEKRPLGLRPHRSDGRGSRVIGIDGARSIAARTGNYRPDNRKPRFEIDESLKGPANPYGILSAEVSAFCYSHGEWHEIVGVAYWNEAAPIKSEPEEFDMQDTGQKWPDSNRNTGGEQLM